MQLPGANVAPAGPSAQAPVYAPTVADAARAVAEGAHDSLYQNSSEK